MPMNNTRKFFKISSYESTEGGYAITLDGRRITTQSGVPFIIPFEGLASAVAFEWNSQVTSILPETMPLTSFCCTTLDTVIDGRDAIINKLAQYAESDLLCYRTDESKELLKHQEDHWQPLLDWADVTYDAKLTVTRGITPVEQPSDAIANLRHAVESLDIFQLTVLTSITQVAGSLVIGLCVICGHISADSAFNTSQLDENWQKKKWGEDAEEIKHSKTLYTEILNAVRFLDLVRAG